MKAIIKLIVFFLLFSVFSCSKPSSKSVHKAILNKNWSFKEVSSKKWLTATIPGCVHTDLMNNKIIDNLMAIFQLRQECYLLMNSICKL